MVEDDPVANRIARREMRMRIVDGEILRGKQLTWSMGPLFVPPAGGDPVFRGSWTHSATHPNRHETSTHFGENGFEAVDQATARTEIDENGESAIRINLPPVGFNKGRLKIEVEDFEGDPAKVADMEVPAVVVIDPGHGGQPAGGEPGGSSWNNATNYGVDPPLSTDPRQQGETWEQYCTRVGKTLEKTLTSQWGHELRTNLAMSMADSGHEHYRIVMTRTGDKNPWIAPRAAFARDNGADVFLSIHFNGHTNPSIHGPETWIEPTASGNVNLAGDNALAGRIQPVLNAAQQPGQPGYRGIKQGTVSGVYRDNHLGNLAKQPPHSRACLVEIDWITNENVEIEPISGPDAATNRAAVIGGLSNAIVEDIEHQE